MLLLKQAYTPPTIAVQPLPYTLHHGDCIAVMRTLPENSIDAIVTDPPAGIHFMNMAFDSDKGGRDMWIAWLSEVMREALRCLKPGGHAFVWALPRTSHWTATALEDAGFEIRDIVVHLFGSGFPKSQDISKAIDRKRDDKSDILLVTKWLNKQIKRADMTYNAILAHFGFNEGSGQIGHWTALSNGAQPTVPTWEQWLELKTLLSLSDEMDAEVWRLNGRKGKPGDAWYEREVIGKDRNWGKRGDVPVSAYGEWDITSPATPDAMRYAGYGTALKPASEHWILCRKPLSEPTIAANVLKHGTGGLNIDKSRISHNEPLKTTERTAPRYSGTTMNNGVRGGIQSTVASADPQGRFPSNLLISHTLECQRVGTHKVRTSTHSVGKNPKEYTRVNNIFATDGGKSLPYDYLDSEGMETVEAWHCSELCPIRLLDEQSGYSKSIASNRGKPWSSTGSNDGWKRQAHDTYTDGYSPHADEGGASRYFATFAPTPDDYPPFYYCSKSSRKERNAGCEGLPEGYNDFQRESSGLNQDRPNREGRKPATPAANNHPTVKSLSLMKYLCTMICPENGVILDPFMGSGSTGVAALAQGFQFVGIEQEEDYLKIAEARVAHAAMEVYA